MQKYCDFLKSHPALRRVLLCLGTLAAACLLTFFCRSWSKFYTGSWDGYSELLSVGRITQMQQGQSTPGGFLGVYTAEWGDGEGYAFLKDNTPQDPANYHSYLHQSGLQGTLFGLLARVLLPFTQNDGELRLSILYFINCTLFYALAICLCRALSQRFGAVTGAFALAALAFSPLLQTGAKNLYWVLFTWLLPCCAAAGQCGFWQRNGRFSKRWLVALFCAVLAKCLCGFEYISTILILCETPLLLFFAQQKGARKPWLWEMVKTGFAALAGVAAALGVWLCQCFVWFGSWKKAADAVLGTVLARAGAETVAGDAASALTAELSAWQVIHQFFADGTVMLQFGPIGFTLPQLVMAVLVFAALFCLAILWGRTHGKKTEASVLQTRFVILGLLWLLCFLAPVSWMVLAKGHAALHTHLTPMLWQFATVPASMAVLGFCVGQGFGFLRKKLFCKKENRG